MRPIFSPTEFVQMKGRGTRTNTFKHFEDSATGERELRTEKKTTFKLFDFFGNIEFFEKKYDYDQQLELPLPSSQTILDSPPERPSGAFVNVNPDPIKSIYEEQIGPQGLKPDRMLFKLEEIIKTNTDVVESYEKGLLKKAELIVRTEIFDKPEEYFNLEKIRKALGLDRKPTVTEYLDFVFTGKHIAFADELFDQEIDTFITIYKPEAKYYPYIRNAFKAILSDREVHQIMRDKDYPLLATNPLLSMSDIIALNGYRDIIPEYIDDYVPLNNFLSNA
jgi:type I restriction enzyme R subunit